MPEEKVRGIQAGRRIGSYHRCMPLGNWRHPLQEVSSRWFSAPLSKDLLDKFGAQKGDPGMNTAWEAMALLVALRLWLPKLPRQLTTRIKSGNVGALRMLYEGPLSTGGSGHGGGQLYQISELEHVPGITNVAADALSRLWAPQPEPFPKLGEAAQDLTPDFWKVG